MEPTRTAGGYTALLAWVAGSTCLSWLRRLMSSLVNTLCRCHSTVRGLRKRRAPISGVREAVTGEVGDQRFVGGEAVAGLDAPLVSGLTGGP
jgi:hypothetical protein